MAKTVHEFLKIYAFLHLFFFSLALYILHKFSLDISTQLEYRSFRFLIVSYLFYVMTSVSATFVAYGLTPLPRWFVYLVWYCNLFCIMLIALSLYMFTVFRHASHITKWKWFTLWSSVPVSIVFLCMLVSLKSGIVLSVTENGRVVYGPVYPALPVLALLYFAAILLFAMAKRHFVHSYVKRRQLAMLSVSVLFVFASVIVDELFRLDYLTILPAAGLCVIVYLYINMQEDSIYIDVLTGMNNRRKAREYLEASLAEVSEGAPLYLYMCDVNFFKKINDEHGHAEGDQALVLTGAVLKTAAAKRDGFAARFGGDEFLLSWTPQTNPGGDEPPDLLIDEVDAALADACRAAKKPYLLTLSIGYTRCAEPERPLADYVRQADEMLYARKRAFHKNADAAGEVGVEIPPASML